MNPGSHLIARNHFLKQLALMAGGVLIPDWRHFYLVLQDSPDPALLSEFGCGRATGYAEANKIITWEDKTHFSWLDSEGDTFWVRVRTYDHLSGQWSPTYTVDSAQDNHGGPAMTIDSTGTLHILYYPHHEPMRYRSSLRPNDVSDWSEIDTISDRATYPSLVCAPDDSLWASFRISYDDKPWEVELWTRKKGGTWSLVGTVLKARYPGYAHFQESLAWSSDGTLHLCCRIHEKSDQDAYGRIQTVGYLKSMDQGRSWTTWMGEKVNLPVTAEGLDPMIAGGLDVGRVLRAGGMAVLPDGKPVLLYSEEVGETARTFIATPSDYGQWNHILLNHYLPPGYTDWSLITPGAICINHEGKLYITAQVVHVEHGKSSWGHPSSEVIQIVTSDFIQFTSRILSEVDASTPNWLPSIERQTGHNQIEGAPWTTFTSGTKGSNNSDILSNEVYAVR